MILSTMSELVDRKLLLASGEMTGRKMGATVGSDVNKATVTEAVALK